MKNVILLIAIVFFCFKFSYGQPGAIDPSFGINGIVKTDLGVKITNTTNIADLVFNPDGSSYIIFQKDEQFYITKNLPDGSTDSTFGNGGFSNALQLNFLPKQTVLQPDGKFLLVGEYGGDVAIARFNIDGNPDSTFSDDGIQTTDFGSYYDIGSRIAIQDDGKIVAMGVSSKNGETFYFILSRYNADGSLDRSFSNDGKQITNFIPYYTDGSGPIAIQDDGKIVLGSNVAGEKVDFLLARFHSDGSTDNSFSEDGRQTTDFESGFDNVAAVVIQNDGKIVAAGRTWNGSNNNFAVARYNVDGSLDNTFNGNGKQITKFPGSGNNEPSSIVYQADGKIIVAGVSERRGKRNGFALARYNTDGTLDKSFSGDGSQTTVLASLNDIHYVIALESGGRILVAARSLSQGVGFGIARYNTNGTLDNTFDDDGKLTDSLSFNEGRTEYTRAAIQRDGKIVAAGYTRKENYAKWHNFLLPCPR